MMNILLVAINARYSHTNLAVRSIVTYCRERQENDPSQVSLDFIEFNINQQPSQILSSLFEQHADIYLFSTYIWNKRIVFDLIDDLKLSLIHI